MKTSFIQDMDKTLHHILSLNKEYLPQMREYEHRQRVLDRQKNAIKRQSTLKNMANNKALQFLKKRNLDEVEDWILEKDNFMEHFAEHFKPRDEAYTLDPIDHERPHNVFQENQKKSVEFIKAQTASQNFLISEIDPNNLMTSAHSPRSKSHDKSRGSLHVFNQHKSNLQNKSQETEVMQRLKNAKQAAEFAEIHMDMHPERLKGVTEQQKSSRPGVKMNLLYSTNQRSRPQTGNAGKQQNGAVFSEMEEKSNKIMHSLKNLLNGNKSEKSFIIEEIDEIKEDPYIKVQLKQIDWLKTSKRPFSP